MPILLLMVLSFQDETELAKAFEPLSVSPAAVVRLDAAKLVYPIYRD